MDIAIAPEVMARYRHSARAREMARTQETEQRRQAAWAVARQAARLLREAFGATRVVVFGSLAHGAWFGPQSDIDLAVEGVAPEAFWRAWTTLDRVDYAFVIDLIAIEEASDSVCAEIADQGIIL